MGLNKSADDPARASRNRPPSRTLQRVEDLLAQVRFGELDHVLWIELQRAEKLLADMLLKGASLPQLWDGLFSDRITAGLPLSDWLL